MVPAGLKQVADVVVVQDAAHIASGLQGDGLTRGEKANQCKRAREKAAKEAKAQERVTQASTKHQALGDMTNVGGISVPV